MQYTHRCKSTGHAHAMHMQCGAQMPMMREAIMKGADWKAIAEAQNKGPFGAEAAQQTEMRRRSLLSSLEALCALEPDQDVVEVMHSLIFKLRMLSSAHMLSMNVSLFCARPLQCKCDGESDYVSIHDAGTMRTVC